MGRSSYGYAKVGSHSTARRPRCSKTRTEMSTTPEPLRYPVSIEFDIHWSEMDAFGHVNNARHFTWFESCRIAYFTRIGLRVDGPSELGPILAHIGCDYLSPIVYPARLVCAARVPKIGNTSFSM